MSKDQHEVDADWPNKASHQPISTSNSSRDVIREPSVSPHITGSGRVRAQGDNIAIPIPLPTQSAPSGGSGTNVEQIDYGGSVLTNVSVYLVYWGSAWERTPTPSVDDITNCVTSILSGPYMSALAQYRNIGSGTLYGTTQVTISDPPGIFSNDDVGNLLKDLIDAKTVPTPGEVDQLLYFVIMPAGVSSDQSRVTGEHFSFGENTFCAWVMNNGTLDYVTTIFSHELVEACTNPKGDGFQINAPGHCMASPINWCEIGDICEGTTKMVNGVVVQAYWSVSDNTCVIPGSSLT